ncbi:hypothetical protein C9374_006747 [Naegleria lovaniensis]|uniref:Phospholipid scramblase n=1 Tax=Naegleria lovaniensis TaxID=51637 RepID=A0AA88KHJ5_NAELO|nr:uncharacterized protein C9374_006747 [Naegleria lovaniensis]KAG2379630.1 hypothetical protein C9374_006747 [Naegleria lovaniensis]
MSDQQQQPQQQPGTVVYAQQPIGVQQQGQPGVLVQQQQQQPMMMMAYPPQQQQPGGVQQPVYIQQQQPGGVQPGVVYVQQQQPGGVQQPIYVQQQQPGGGVYVPPQSQVVVTMPSSGGGSGSLLDQIFAPNHKVKVKQRIEPFELLTGFETENRYDIHFENGYEAVALEESDCCARQYCGPRRPFKIHIALKGNGQEFITLDRPWCWMFHEVNVFETATNTALGKVELRCSFFSRELNIFDASGAKIFDIVSPCCECWTFYIEKNGQRVGEIRKKWSGFLKEAFTDADNFGIEFPTSATTKEKAILLGALFLIDFLYFEESANNNNNRRAYW